MKEDGEVEYSLLVWRALWTKEVSVPLGEVCGERSNRHILQRTTTTRYSKIDMITVYSTCNSLLANL